MGGKIKVSGVGCSLIDRIYNNISFRTDTFAFYLTKESGDGGLYPGHLVFKEEFERFCNKSFQSALKEITAQKKADKLNVGGPCIVALIHASQLTYDVNCEFSFYGCRGNDVDGVFLQSSLEQIRVDISNYRIKEDYTPSTIVFSDPDYDNGNGERIFINQLGAAADYSPQELDDDFFNSNICVFGGTALVPKIHDNLMELLYKAKSNSAITIVNTVYDYRNQKIDPVQKWPLGSSDESYRYIDLLIIDREESLRLSGKKNIPDALKFFKKNGTGAVIVTAGAEDVHFYSEGSMFHFIEHTTLPVSNMVSEKIREGVAGDSTGCGDNFVGGVIASIVEQLSSLEDKDGLEKLSKEEMGGSVDKVSDVEKVTRPDKKEHKHHENTIANEKKLNLLNACGLGVVSGGFTCMYMGGTYFEKYKGEKKELLMPFYRKYKEQILV